MKTHVLLRFALRFLRLFCPPHLLEEIEGDLWQKFGRDVRRFGERKSRWRFAGNVVLFCRPGIVMRNQFRNPMQTGILRHAALFTGRSLLRHKLFSVVNLAGLTAGLTVCLLMINYVMYERSYDRFHEKADRIVRIYHEKMTDGELQYSKAQVYPAVRETLLSDVPEVQEVVRLFPVTTFVEAVLAPVGPETPTRFSESNLFAVDSSFLNVFTLDFLYGDPATALNAEKSMILSASAATKYFGAEDALNKVIHWEGMGDWKVTGVFHDLPGNSHIHFDHLVTGMKVYGDRSLWNWDAFYTYVLLRPGTDRVELEAKIQKLLSTRMASAVEGGRITSRFHLQPLSDIHLKSQLSGELEVNGSDRLVDSLLVVALFILALAVVNYLNLSLARVVQRTREAGLRKIVGSTRGQLMFLFFTETLILCAIGFLFAVGGYFLLSPLLNDLVGKTVGNVIFENTGFYLLLIPVALILLSLLTSVYPSMQMAAVHPAQAIKGLRGVFRGPLFGQSLLVFQFLVTIVILTGAGVVWSQLNHMKGLDLGFEINGKIIIKTFNPSGGEMDTANLHKLTLLKTAISGLPGVRLTTITSNIPGRENDWLGRLRSPEGESALVTTMRTRVDKDFIPTYGLRLIEGRNFSDDDSQHHVVLNETAVKQLGFKSNAEALGNKIMRDHLIIGVVRDFHERALSEPLIPAMYTTGEGYMKYLTVDMISSDLSGLTLSLQHQWREIFPDRPFEFFFLDEFFDHQYQKEVHLGRIVTVFSALGIFVACMGLFGFTYYMLQRRVKEISVRKTLGAGDLSLIRLFVDNYLMLLFIAGMLAIPISYWIGVHWLSGFPQQVKLNWMNFLFPVLSVMVLVLTAIGSQVRIATRVNPIIHLKHE